MKPTTDWQKLCLDLCDSIESLGETKLTDVGFKLQAMRTRTAYCRRLELLERGVTRLWRLGGDYNATVVYMEQSDTQKMFYKGQLFDFGMERANTNFSYYLDTDAHDGGCALIPRAMLEMIEVSIDDNTINWAGVLS